jgi:predicted ester cyclase
MIMGELRETIDAYYRALDNEGPEAGAPYWSANCDFAAPGARGRGPDFIRGFIQVFYEGNPDLKHTVTSSVELGDTIALEVTVEGTNTGPLRLPAGEVPPTGKAWRLPACVMFRVQDGVFKSYHIYLDMADFLAQIGLMPEAVTA